MRSLALGLFIALTTTLDAQTAGAPPPQPLPAIAAGNVAIPLAEYNRLADQAAQAPRRAGDPPQPYAIRSAEYRLRVEKDMAAGTLEFLGEVLQQGPTAVELVSGLTVLDARQRGRPLPLAAQKGGGRTAMVDGIADFQIQLDCAIPLLYEAGRAGLTLPGVAAGALRLELTLPGEQTAVSLSPGLIVDRSSTGGLTTIRATLQPGKPVTLWWGARLAPAPAVVPVKPPRFLSDVKSLITVTQTEIAITALADLTVVEGRPTAFEFTAPDGFEVTGIAGPTLADSDSANGRVHLRVAAPATQSHQFLIEMSRAVAGGSKPEIVLPGFTGAQRETGELLVEGEGALELAARERGGLRRMDLREASEPLRNLAGHSVQAAFRYQRRSGAPEPAGVTLEWVRFPSQPALPAISGHAAATTLLTREGRSLTEVRLTVRNQSQPFARIGLPPGAVILTAEVAGEKVKPVEAADGNRVPLLRPGFRPSGPYTVSFVFSHTGAPLVKKGSGEITLPKMDLPVSALEWELFLPSEVRVSAFGGDALPAGLLPRSSDGDPSTAVSLSRVPVGPGEVGGTVIDPSGALIAGARIEVAQDGGGRVLKATADNSGNWRVRALPSGRVKITASQPGFKTTVRYFEHRSSEPLAVTLTLDVGAVTESVEVSSGSARLESQQAERLRRQNAAFAGTAASANVLDLQKRLAGVLPVAVSIPRTGNAYRFVRPLVIDEESRLTFQYRAAR